MAIEFGCPQCGFRMQAPEAMAGQSGPCSKCGATVTVPRAAPPPPPAFPQPGFSPPGFPQQGFPQQGFPKPPPAKSSNTMLYVVFGVAGLGVLACCVGGGFVGWSAYTEFKAVKRQAVAQNNAKMIALALHNYHDDWGCLPPPVVYGPNGEPLYSWRVVLLPYLGREDLYAQFDKDRAWDDPANISMSAYVPVEYADPTLDETRASEGLTYFLAFAGPGAAFDPKTKVRLTDITDGTSNTVLFASSQDSGVVWTEPRDFDAGIMSAGINDVLASPPVGDGAGDVITAFADGSVVRAPPLPAQITRAGGEF
jgi:hypothetical protein